MPARFKNLVILGLLCLGGPGVAGCGSHSFDVVRTAQSSLQAGGDASHMDFADFAPVNLLDDQIMTLQHIARRQLSHIGVHAATLTVRTPGATQDLTFLSSVSVAISAPGLPTKNLATGQNFGAGLNVGVLQVDTGDFIDYFRSSDPTLTVVGQGQAPVDMTLELEVALALEVSSGTILFQ